MYMKFSSPIPGVLYTGLVIRTNVVHFAIEMQSQEQLAVSDAQTYGKVQTELMTCCLGRKSQNSVLFQEQLVLALITVPPPAPHSGPCSYPCHTTLPLWTQPTPHPLWPPLPSPPPI